MHVTPRNFTYSNRITDSWREIERERERGGTISRICSLICVGPQTFCTVLLDVIEWRQSRTPPQTLGLLFWSALYRADVRSIVAAAATAVTSALENSYDTQYDRTRDKARARQRANERGREISLLAKCHRENALIRIRTRLTPPSGFTICDHFI